MGHKNTNDFPLATEGMATWRRRRWMGLVAVGAVLVLLLLFLFRDWLSNFWPGEDDSFPPGVLADYVPEDSQALLFMDARALRDSPMGRQRLEPLLQKGLQRAGQELRWMELFGINPLADLDTILISFSPSSGAQPLSLLRGRFDRSRLQQGPDKLHATKIDHLRVWEYTDRAAKETTLLALLGDMLVVGETRDRVAAALRQARAPHPLTVRDATLRQALAEVDRRQTVWLAASKESLAPLDEIKELALLRPLWGHMQSIYGGIICGDDVRAEFHFEAATEEEAIRLETTLQNLREAAPGAAFLLRRQKEWLPLLRLLAVSTIVREGKSIRLRSRLAADQWGE